MPKISAPRFSERNSIVTRLPKDKRNDLLDALVEAFQAEKAKEASGEDNGSSDASGPSEER